MVNDTLKIKAMQSLMKNPKMAKMVFTALKSSPGSTKRTEMKNVLDSFYAVHINRHNKEALSSPRFLGQGGPVSPQQEPAAMGAMAPMPVSMVAAPAEPTAPRFAPKPARKMPQGQSYLPPFHREIQMRSSNGGPNVLSPDFQGQGGPYDGKGGDLPGNTSYNTDPGFFGQVGSWFKNLFTPGTAQAAAPAPAPAPSQLSVTHSPGPQPTITVGGTSNPAVNAPSFNPQQGSSSPLQNTGTINTPMSNPQSGNASPVGLNFPNLTVSHGNQPAPAITPPAGSAPTTPAPTGQSQSTSGAPYGPMMQQVSDTSGNPPLSPDSLHDYILKQVQAGVPADEVVLAIMADSKKMQQLFPNTPADQIPVGASLTGQLTDLEKRLREEDGLTQTHDALMSSLNDQGNVTGMAEDYIRGKDTYLNQVNTMLTNATSQYWNSGQTDNPFYQQQMGNYINYLTILKGRQTQRYTDFVNQSITYQNNQVNQLQNAYNAASEKVNQDYRNQSALTVEQYDETKQTLTDMYNNIAQRAGIITGMSKSALDSIKTNADTVKSILDAAAILPANQRNQLVTNMGAGNLLQGVDLQNLNKGKAATMSTADLNMLNNSVFPNAHSPIEALNNPLVTSNDMDKGAVLQQFVNYRADTLKKADFGKNLGQLFQDDNSAITSLINSDPTTYGASPDEWSQTVQSYLNQIKNAYSSGIDTYVNDHEADLRDALNNMSGFNGSYADWKKKYAKDVTSKWSSISDAMLQRLFLLAESGSYSSGTTNSEIASSITGSVTESFGQGGMEDTSSVDQYNQNSNSQQSAALNSTPDSLLNVNNP